ncbi:hypothetical protein [Streptomyces radicis]|uniref:Uncharacterized protein n=1 Tax=Streptomyces radicis TaxID=1750517 RepID=A0A3A9WBX3_9ACTN|nr:hypothetical protein [Streptomyces radicis]RKN10861.1 hypothetical protein D7319_06825 [Streptomyces radicis]RKN25125.1 hypothetical protein D7318_07680 [Streptomyces radicis]
MVAAVGVLVLLRSLFRGETYRWVAEIGDAMPVSAWEALILNPARDHPTGTCPVSITEAWLVHPAWPVAAVALAPAVVRRRDV